MFLLSKEFLSKYIRYLVDIGMGITQILYSGCYLKLTIVKLAESKKLFMEYKQFYQTVQIQYVVINQHATK